MKEKILAHMGSLLGGVVHNLNTPLMWVLGRAQLVQSRMEKAPKLSGISEEEYASMREKNLKDIASIIEGAEKIDSILKGLGYKIQMVNEGFAALELREYLEMETNFLMADMRFKHDTTRLIDLGHSSHYTKVDYNALSASVTGVINAMMDHTEKGRTIKITLNGGVIHLCCPEMRLDAEAGRTVKEALEPIEKHADVYVDDANGIMVTIALRDR